MDKCFVNDQVKLNFKEYSKLFIYFLEENNIREKFLINCRKHQVRLSRHCLLSYTFFNPLAKEIIMDELKVNRGKNIISSAFIWEATIEGHSFWEEKNEKWKHFIEKNNLYFKGEY